MTSHDLHVSEPAGNREPLNRIHRIDGRRVSLAQFQAIEREARVRGVLDSFSTANVGGVVHHYSVARVPSEVAAYGPDDSDVVSLPYQEDTRDPMNLGGV